MKQELLEKQAFASQEATQQLLNLEHGHMHESHVGCSVNPEGCSGNHSEHLDHGHNHEDHATKHNHDHKNQAETVQDLPETIQKVLTTDSQESSELVIDQQEVRRRALEEINKQEKITDKPNNLIKEKEDPLIPKPIGFTSETKKMTKKKIAKNTVNTNIKTKEKATTETVATEAKAEKAIIYELTETESSDRVLSEPSTTESVTTIETNEQGLDSEVQQKANFEETAETLYYSTQSYDGESDFAQVAEPTEDIEYINPDNPDINILEINNDLPTAITYYKTEPEEQFIEDEVAIKDNIDAQDNSTELPVTEQVIKDLENKVTKAIETQIEKSTLIETSAFKFEESVGEVIEELEQVVASENLNKKVIKEILLTAMNKLEIELTDKEVSFYINSFGLKFVSEVLERLKRIESYNPYFQQLSTTDQQQDSLLIKVGRLAVQLLYKNQTMTAKA